MLMGWFLVACGQAINSSETGDSASSGDTAEDSGSVETDDDGEFLYDDKSILDFSITVDSAGLASLAADPRTDVHATFSFQGTDHEVGLHIKGSESGSLRTMDEKASFKVDFHQWDADARFYGLKRLTLNNMIQDSTMSHEHAAYRLFRDLGIPAARHGYAKVTVNGDWFGLYGVVETMDEQFLNRAFPGDDEGYLYEGGYGGDFGEGQAQHFDAKEYPGETPDTADLEALVDRVHDTQPAEMLALIESTFEAERLFSMWGGEVVIADTDGYTSLANNFLVYHAPIADIWTMIPWGPDQAFLDDEPVWIDFYGALAEKCVEAADCKAEMAAGVERALAVLDTDAYRDWVDTETARIETDCREDPRSQWGDYGCRDALAAMRDWVKARPAVIRAEIGQ